MIRKLISALIVTIWIGGILNLRYGSSPNILILMAVFVLWFAGITAREKVHFGFIKKIDYQCTRFLDAMGDKTLFFNVWILGFLCFMPAFIAFFPGIFGYDAPAQFAMFMGQIPFQSATHPLFHTLLIGGVISFGKMIFGSYQAGFVCLVILQGILISNCMAFVFLFLRKRNVPILIILLGFLWLIGNPYIQILNCNVTKDVMFGVFFTDFVMAVMHGYEKEKLNFLDIAAVFVSGLLMCLFRNGLVLAVIILLICSLLLRMKKRRIYLTYVGIILFVELFSFSFRLWGGIEKGPEKEFLAVPIQQISYVMYLNATKPGSVNVSEVEWETFLELVPSEEELVSRFDIFNSDSPKTMFQESTFKQNRFRYITLYFNVGKKNPVVYLRGWLQLIRPYFNMNLNDYKSLMIHDYFTLYFDRKEVDIRPAPKYLSEYRNYLENSATGHVSFFNEPFLPILFLGLMIGWAVVRKSKSLFLGGLMYLIYFFGILMGPVALMRYTYPLMLAMPLMFGLFFCGGKYVPENIKQEKLFEEVKNS